MSSVIIGGDISGSCTLQAPAVSGTSVLTLPVATDTLVGKATTDTLTNKTLTTPTISSLSSASATALTLQSAGTTAITVDTSQNVGIGTASPASKLAVGGNPPTAGALAAVSSSGGVSLALSDNVNNSLYVKHVASGIATFGTDSGGQIAFATNGFTERMRIDSNGKILIGATSSNSGTRLSTISSTSGVDTNTSVILSTSGTRYHWAFKDGTSETERGTITTNGSATAYNTTSDYRLKENILPMTGALATVQALKPVTYTWKESGDNSQGFIAHELEAVVPDCVTGEKDAVETYTDEEGNEQTRAKYQSVDTSFLVATLTSAIQELKAIIDTQAERIKALEDKP